MNHPVTSGKAAGWHTGFTLMYVVALWFHGVSAWRHYQDWRAGK